MAQLTAAEFTAKWLAKFPDNNTGMITEAFMREFSEDIADSFVSPDVQAATPTQSGVVMLADIQAGNLVLSDGRVITGEILNLVLQAIRQGLNNKENKGFAQQLIDALIGGADSSSNTLKKLADKISGITRIDRKAQTISERDTLPSTATPPLVDQENVYVQDATGDNTVEAGPAIYKWIASIADWIKISEPGAIDFALTALATSFDPAGTGLLALNVQAAIVELKALIDALAAGNINLEDYVEKETGGATLKTNPVIAEGEVDVFASVRDEGGKVLLNPALSAINTGLNSVRAYALGLFNTLSDSMVSVITPILGYISDVMDQIAQINIDLGDKVSKTADKGTVDDILNAEPDKFPDAQAVSEFSDYIFESIEAGDAQRMLNRIKGNGTLSTYDPVTKTITLPAFTDSEVNFMAVDMTGFAAGTYVVEKFAGGVSNRGFFFSIFQVGGGIVLSFQTNAGNNLGSIVGFNTEGTLRSGEARYMYRQSSSYILTYKVNNVDLSSAAGIPSLTGNSLKYLRAKADETGLEFSEVAGVGVTDGDKTDIVVSGSGTSWLVKASRILGQALTGLGSLTGDLSATDTIVQAFSKIYYFMTNIAATIRGTVMTGLDTNQAGFPAATDSLLVILGKLTRLVNSVPASPTSGTWTGTTVDFGVGYQTRAFSNTQVIINGFSNTSLGKKVRIEITSANAADSLAFNVAGWTRQDIGFPFVPLVTNIVEIHIVGASTYETFITPLTA